MALDCACMGVPTIPGEQAMLLCSAPAKSVRSAVRSIASRLRPARSERWIWVSVVAAWGVLLATYVLKQNPENRHIRCKESEVPFSERLGCVHSSGLFRRSGWQAHGSWSPVTALTVPSDGKRSPHSPIVCSIGASPAERVQRGIQWARNTTSSKDSPVTRSCG